MDKEKSVWKSSAESGVFFGIYLSATFLSFIYSTSAPIISLLGLALFFGTPIVLAVLMHRYHMSHPATSSFTSVCMYGTGTFLFGSLIWAALAFVVLEYIEPGFITSQATQALALYESTPEMKELDFTKALRAAIENKELPTPIDFCMQMVWMSISIGMFLSLFITPIVRLFKHKNK